VAYYAAPFTFDFSTSLIEVDNGTTDVACIDLYTAIKAAQASQEGIQYERIGSGSGLIELGPGVQVGLTVELLGLWQLHFQPGNYIARVSGGNLVGGPGGDPVAYSSGVQSLIIQSAASTVVTAGGSIPTALSNAILQIDEVHRIHGLKAGEPMTVTPTSRHSGNIAQTIGGDGTTISTVTRV